MESQESKSQGNNDLTFDLPSGRKCIIKKGKGKNITEAMKTAGKEGERFLFAMICQLTTVDGNPIVIEDLEEMELKDAMDIQTKFSEINF